MLLVSLVLAVGLAARELLFCVRGGEKESVAMRLPIRQEIPHLLFGLACGASR